MQEGLQFSSDQAQTIQTLTKVFHLKWDSIIVHTIHLLHKAIIIAVLHISLHGNMEIILITTAQIISHQQQIGTQPSPSQQHLTFQLKVIIKLKLTVTSLKSLRSINQCQKRS